MLYFGINSQIDSCCYFLFQRGRGESLTTKLNRIKRFAYFVCIYNLQQTNTNHVKIPKVLVAITVKIQTQTIDILEI